jgi:hypothetical protein
MIGQVEVLAYGLGWYVFVYKGRYMVVHGGDAVGQSTLLMLAPEENLAVAVFLNTLSWVFPFIGVYITDALLDDEPPRDHCGEAMAIFRGIQQQAAAGIQQFRDARDKTSSPTLPLEGYVGTYTSDLFGEIEISLGDGQLIHSFGGSGKYDADLEHWEHDTFLANYNNRHTEPELLTFAVGEDGKVGALDVRSMETFVDTFRSTS